MYAWHRKKFLAAALVCMATQMSFAENQSDVKNASEQPKCATLPEDMEQRFYSILLESKNVSDTDNQVINASNFVGKVQDKCNPLSAEQASVVIDLQGEAARIGYRLSGQKRFFDISENAYKKALDLGSERDELIYWHLAMLMQSAGKYDQATNYINKVFSMNPSQKHMMEYLETALQLSVEQKLWGDALRIMGAMQKYDKNYYGNLELLRLSVLTLCNNSRIEDAKKFIQNVENHVVLDNKGKEKLLEIKKIVEDFSGLQGA